MAGEGLADLYVRHAMPLVDPDQPSSEWEARPAGRAAARELAFRLELDDPVAMVVSSTERKALATAEPIAERFGVTVRPDERLVEVERPWIGVRQDYRVLAHRFLAGEQPEGWEDRGVVVDRMAAAVTEARAGVTEGLVAVIGHGLSVCVHLESQLPPGFDPSGLWARLSFPDAWILDRTDLLLSRCAR